MYLEFEVEDQVLTNTLYKTIASGSEGFLKAKFNKFSTDWDDCTKVAQFKVKPNATPVEKYVINGECDIPPEVMTKQGVFFIAVRGVGIDDTEKKPTTTVVPIKVSTGAVPSGQLPTQPTQPLIDQVLSAVASLEERLENGEFGSGEVGTGEDGKSAYEIAVDNGFVGTEAEWLLSLKGADGDDGKSAYQIWLDNGHSGTEAEFLLSLKGQDNTGGTNGLSFEDWTDGEEVSLGTETPATDTTPPILTVTPDGATFDNSQVVTISTDEMADIYYTLDGSTPTTASTVYSGQITLNATTTIKAFAKDTAGNSSSVQTLTFTKSTGDVTPPIVTVNPIGGMYNTSKNVSLTPNEFADIYYTLDGSTPTESSSVYTTPILITKDTTLKFFAKDVSGNVSNVVTENYNIVIAYDTFSRVDSETLGVTEISSLPWVEPTSFNNMVISNNKVKCNTAGVLQQAVIDVGVSDIEITADIIFGTYAGILFRNNTPNDNSFFFKTGLGDTRVGAYKNNSTSVSLGTNPYVPTTGQTITMKVRLQGNNIKCYIDNTLYFDITDTFDTGGHKVGLVLHNDNTTLIDNFKVSKI